jgi:hypothetical protein
VALSASNTPTDQYLEDGDFETAHGACQKHNSRR